MAAAGVAVPVIVKISLLRNRIVACAIAADDLVLVPVAVVIGVRGPELCGSLRPYAAGMGVSRREVIN